VSSFVPGLQLCRTFYFEAVRPLLDQAYPGLPHAAARVGPGSEVLGFDSQRSVDHDWGPRLELFLSPEDVAQHSEDLSALLTARLPKHVGGWPTHFEPPGARVRLMTATTGPVAHRVQITDVASWSVGQVGFDASRGATVDDWLATPSQLLAEAVGGEIFQDDVGDLTAVRDRLRWYPDDLWRYLLAAQWTRIGQEEAFVGRAAEAGDELGSRLIAARLARDVMRLCMVLERRYAPYSKWLGTAFAALPDVEEIAAALQDAVEARGSDLRQSALCTAYEAAGRWQNRLRLADPVEATRRPYRGRPFPVIDASRFATALVDSIEDETVARLPLIGAIDQYVDSLDVLGRRDLTRRITATPTYVHISIQKTEDASPARSPQPSPE
jgi:hypothetical protein